VSSTHDVAVRSRHEPISASAPLSGIFRNIRPGRETLPPGFDLSRHRHLQPYALAVITGAFEQTSYAGRIIVRAGDLLVQPTLDCHANRLLAKGAQILRLSWPHVGGFGGVYRLRDLDDLVRCAERDVIDASAMAQAAVGGEQPLESPVADWPDMLASDIRQTLVTSLAEWARSNRMAAETVSRGFTRVYGVGPAQFRHEIRTRTAWLQIVGTHDALASIADETGFADQAHMTRSVGRLTGSTPSAWRASGSNVRPPP
jgi:AraC-like DNA-binding protein